MYKIYLDESSYEHLRTWAETVKRYALDCPPVARKFLIILKNPDYGMLEFYVSSTSYGYKFSMKDSTGQLCKGSSIRTPNGNHDNQMKVSIVQNVPKEKHIVVCQLAQIYMTAFLHANAFLMYGNIVDDKGIVATGRNSGFDKIIVFRKFKDKLYAVPVGHHRSPEGVFEVRGHFRFYKKTGKVIWIESYLKGTENTGIEELD